MNAADLTIKEAGAKLRNGSLSSVALTQAHLERIKARDPVYHAFITITEEQALASAARADAELAGGNDKGPLHGIPIAIKDVIETEGVRTTHGTGAFEWLVPDKDAEVVRWVRQAGANVLGKLATYEFGMVGPSFDLPFPPVANPWNVAHITGGSSSGCASAVAGGLVRTAIGTDTGGSLRSPASYCGVVGLKPTFGRSPSTGILPHTYSLDHVGSISATVAEAAVTLDVIASGNERDIAPAASLLGTSIEGLRIAYARDWFAHDPETMPEVVVAMDDAASQLTLLGARVEEIKLPDYAVFEACGAVLIHAEALAIHKDTLRSKAKDFGRLAFQSLASGLCLTADDLAHAQAVASALKDEMHNNVFSKFDALITTTTLTTAPPFSAFDGKSAVWTPMRTLPFNVTGHPALSLPIGFARGLPIGMQIVGNSLDEARVCQIGDAFEQSTDHTVMKPPPIAAWTAALVEAA